MSLLLDALKKAESEKKKSSGDADRVDDALQVDESAIDTPGSDNESLELELELDNPSNHDTAENAFPEVDEETINKQLENQTQVTAEQHENQSSDETPSDDHIEEIATSSTATVDDSPIHIESSADSVGDQGQTDVQDSSADVTTEIQHENISEEIADTAEPDTNIPKAEDLSSTVSRIESEKALSALINKTNQHQRKENLKRNITIIILVFLIVIGSALYFYIETSTTSQSLYLAQNNQASIDRSKDIVQSATNQQQDTMPPVTKPASQKTSSINKIPDTPAITTTARKAIESPKNTKASQSGRVTEKQPSQTLSIVHSTRPDPVDALLQQAYRSFQSGDLQTSESLYSQVLQRESNNRDAILGLSAIAMKQQRYEYARQKYQFLLKLNPRDSIAIAGINSLESKVYPQLGESQLKFMLKQQPDDPHLYFALGSLYAQQQRWAEAQSAYFSAWSADTENADYAFNLAVSLDHMSKQKQALQFYQRSLQLLPTSNANFSAEQARARIATLLPRFQ